MDVVGIRSRVLRGAVVPAVACPYCGRMGQEALGVLSYAHLLGLPLVPVARQALTECPFCHHTVTALAHSREVDGLVRARVFRPGRLLPTFVAALVLAAVGIAGSAWLLRARSHGVQGAARAAEVAPARHG
jgi:hypothetical protein